LEFILALTFNTKNINKIQKMKNTPKSKLSAAAATLGSKGGKATGPCKARSREQCQIAAAASHIARRRNKQIRLEKESAREGGTK
jgi:hypothetical protein